MSNAALIQIGDDVIEALKKFKGDDQLRAVKLVITAEALAVSEFIAGTGDFRDDFDGLADHVQVVEPCFILTRLEKGTRLPEYVLVVYIAVGSPVRPRTIFASGRVPVQRQLGQLFTGMDDYFVDDTRDLKFASYLAQKSRDESALSVEEVQMRKEKSEEAVVAATLPEHDGFTWPLDGDLKEKLAVFATGDGPTIVAGKASDTGGAIACAGTGTSLSQIDSSGPRYVALRWQSGGAVVVAFLLFCPDNAPARQKMMSSTCRASFLKGCAEAGIEFVKRVEIREAGAWGDDTVEELINPREVDHGYGEVKAFKKPARPGRR